MKVLAHSVAALTLVVLALLSTFPGSATAKQIEGVHFADTLATPHESFTLHNLALFRWKIFFKVYVAALYRGEGVSEGSILGDTPKRLEIEYFVGFSADDFIRSTRAVIRRSVDQATYDRLRPSIERLNALYRPVKEGDRYALTYLPSVGTELSLNGRPLGVVEGDELSRAVFGIWLGRKPLDESFRDRLLQPSA